MILDENILQSPVVVARKPLEENTVVDNILKWGTGGINIDGSRIGTEILKEQKAGQSKIGTFERKNMITPIREGRFPANLILDEEAGKVLDEQSGISKSSGGSGEKSKGGLGNQIYGKYKNETHAANAGGLGDVGGASRFFYSPKLEDDELKIDNNKTDMKLILGDCLDKLKELEDNSVDSIVTDPPYGLSFMGKKWDYDVPSKEIWEECMRVLKPGGHLLAFAGSRTYHRMAVRIEDAGFEIRDMISWIYGSGFPKSMDISKQIDKKFGAEREVVGKREHPTLKDKSKLIEPSTASHGGNEWNREWDITKPSTDLAKQWQGWGTALKPAHEPVVMARKPLEENTVVDNILKYGTGAINIDESRIPTDETITNHSRSAESAISKGKYGDSSEQETHQTEGQKLGRFPANLILDEEAGEMLDEQTGELKSGFMKAGTPRLMSENPNKNTYGEWKPDTVANDTYGDSGGASRFFYCPKTSKKERNEGLDGTIINIFYELNDDVSDDVKNQIKNILKL